MRTAFLFTFALAFFSFADAALATSFTDEFSIKCVLSGNSDGNPFPLEIGKFQHGPLKATDPTPVIVDMGGFQLLISIAAQGTPPSDLREALSVMIVPLPSPDRPLPAAIDSNEGAAVGEVAIGGGIELKGNFDHPVVYKSKAYDGFSYSCEMLRTK